MISRIKTLIKKQGKTIKEVEKDLNLGNGSISKWDKSSPKLENILKIANYLNTSIDYLATGKEIEISPEDKNILELYHKADEIDKQTINNVLSRYKEHNSKLSSSQSEIS